MYAQDSPDFDNNLEETEDLEEDFDEPFTNEEFPEEDETIDDEDEISLEDLNEEFSNQELDSVLEPGITPDSPFYFVDKWFDGEDSRAEKIAETRLMIQEGKTEEARKALEEYKIHARELENNPDPEKRETTRRDAAAIQKALRELDDTEFNEEFESILETERNLVTAVEISSKIKELCILLAAKDPGEFHKTCKTENDSPKWQKDYFEDLTDEQKAEAERFINVISDCFENPENCKCEESTNIESFVEQCKIISEAEEKCREGDDTACNTADEAGERIFETLSSAPHLQEALERIEEKFNDFEDDRFDEHMPPECREAGATTPDECRKIMISTHAPEECREELEKAAPKNEREARAICEEIMFNLNAPEECIKARLKDHKECGKFMFNLNAPPECINAGITGENRNDPRKCEEIMNNLREEDRSGPNRGPGRGFNHDCKNIENSEERLKCYDGALQSFEGGENFQQKDNFEDRFKETKERERQCAESCNGAWSFYNGECSCRTENNEYREFQNRREFEPREGFTPPQNGFPPDFTPPEGFTPPPEFSPPQEQGSFEPPPESPSGSEGESSSGSSDSEGGDSGEGGGITGGVIFDNDFLRYFFK